MDTRLEKNKIDTYMESKLSITFLEAFEKRIKEMDKNEAVYYVLRELLTIQRLIKYGSDTDDTALLHTAVLPMIQATIPFDIFRDSKDCAIDVRNLLIRALVGDEPKNIDAFIQQLNDQLDNNTSSDVYDQAYNLGANKTLTFNLNELKTSYQKDISNHIKAINNKIFAIEKNNTSELLNALNDIDNMPVCRVDTNLVKKVKIKSTTQLDNGDIKILIETPLLFTWQDNVKDQLSHSIQLTRTTEYLVGLNGHIRVASNADNNEQIRYQISDTDVHSRLELSDYMKSDDSQTFKESLTKNNIAIEFSDPEPNSTISINIANNAFSAINESHNINKSGPLFYQGNQETAFKSPQMLLDRSPVVSTLKEFYADDSVVNAYMALLLIAEYQSNSSTKTIEELKNEISTYCSNKISTVFESEDDVKKLQLNLLEQVNKKPYLFRDGGDPTVYNQRLDVGFFSSQVFDITRGESYIPNSYSEDKTVANFIEYIRSKQPEGINITVEQCANIAILMIQNSAVSGGIIHQLNGFIADFFEKLNAETPSLNKANNITKHYVDSNGHYIFCNCSAIIK